MKRLLFLFILLNAFYSFQQELEVMDSLMDRENSNVSYKTKVDEINQLADSIKWVNPDSALVLLENAQIISSQIGYIEGTSKSLILNSSANYLLGRTDIALKSGLEAILYAETSNNDDLIAESANNLGLIYQDLKDYDTSIDYFQKAIKYSKSDDKKHSVINNIANSYYFLGEFEKSLIFHDKALKIRTKLNDISGIADCLNDIGLVNFEMGKTDLAINNIKRCLFIKDSIGDVEGIAFSSLDLASIYLKIMDFKNAKNYAQIGLNAALTLSSKKYKQLAYQILSTAQYELGNYKRAYDLHVLYSFTKDSILNEETLKNISALEAKYENEKNLSEIDRLEKEKEIEKRESEIKSTKIQRDRIIKYAMFGGLLLLFLLAIVLIKGIKRRKKDNELITEQNLELEEQKREIREQHSLLETHHKEVTDSITYAERIQNAILPPIENFKSVVPNSFILYLPKDIVAGDFYWLDTAEIQSIENEVFVLFAAADCTGHGVPGAMVSVVCHNALNRSVREFELIDPGAILDKTRILVSETFENSKDKVRDGMDIALCAIDFTNKKLKYSGANNPLWIIKKTANISKEVLEKYTVMSNTETGVSLIEIKANKQPIGVYEHPKPFVSHSFDLQEEDEYYIFSDGFADQFGLSTEAKTNAEETIKNKNSTIEEVNYAKATLTNGKKYKNKRFKEFLISTYGIDSEEKWMRLKNEFDTWKGDFEQLDDICIIGFKI